MVGFSAVRFIGFVGLLVSVDRVGFLIECRASQVPRPVMPVGVRESVGSFRRHTPQCVVEIRHIRRCIGGVGDCPFPNLGAGHCVVRFECHCFASDSTSSQGISIFTEFGNLEASPRTCKPITKLCFVLVTSNRQ